MTDFLLELRSEEIPARMQDKARDDLARLFAAELDKAGLRADAIVTFATPRRLTLIARELPIETEATTEERKGPRADAPAQALEGFLRSTGLTRDQLEERDDGKGNKVLFAVTQKPGRATADVLAEAIPAIIRAFPWPKSMRWGDASSSTESLRWVRPLQGIVALLGDDVVSFEIAGIASGAATVGHRFHHPGVITIGNAGDYADKLRACHVLVDQDERRTIIREGAQALAAEAGLELIEDEGLVAENAGLTEWPVPLLGRFDPAFLSVPPEVIQLTARVNQKYFVCRIPPRNGEGDHTQHGGGGLPLGGTLANAFICTANIDAVDGGAKIVEGNRKVLAARLSDAKFFYETDLKVPLDEQAKKLEKIVFHEKLGTLADKVERVAKLARWLVEEGIVTSSPLPLAGGVGGGPVTTDGAASDTPSPNPSRKREGDEVAALADMAERAARLAKADLVTGMVGEFPELQGVMGGYYARAQGEPAEVADAVRDHYKPVGQGDDVPTAPVTVAVSLADKLDNMAGFFTIGEPPTGSRDPYALRRAALGVLRLILMNGIRAEYDLMASRARLTYFDTTLSKSDYWDDQIDTQLTQFIIERLKIQQREAGVRHDLIDAVTSFGEDDLVRLLARVHALQAFVTTEDGTNLLAGYKRASNILKKEGYTPLPAGEGPGADAPRGEGDASLSSSPSPSHSAAPSGPLPLPLGEGLLGYAPEPAEAALIAALDSAAPRAATAVEAEDFEAAMAALASLRAPIDRFFDDVTVNDPDPAKREARLALLARVRDAVHSVADFSKIEG
ncbi:MAG: glycine--tRNA ligase subunit beta [Sphingomonas sp.]|uniref:glycine--tRNA ligase subunit beta n=1 Tax=Sphingomonas sp. TaxID=28214 RepID=UPI003561B65A